MKVSWLLAVLPMAVLLGPAHASAQVAPCAASEVSTNLPPDGSGPIYRCAQVIAHAPGDRVTEVESMIDPQTYGSLLTVAWSLRSQNRWMPYDEAILRADFWKLWRSEFLEDLWIEVIDEPFENGVEGKHVIFHFEERARVKVVDYVPASGDKLKVDISKIESTLRERDLAVRLDSFIDEARLRRVIGAVRELHAELGYNDATITTDRAPVGGSSRLLHLTFRIDPGPKVEVAEVLFDGNEAFTDGKLRRQMAHNKPNGLLGLFGDATYQETKFPEDAERISEFYKSNGYASAQIGQPVIETVRTSDDGSTRSIRVRVPVDEGMKYTVGTFEITGESKLNLDAIKSLFKIASGDTYSSEKVRKGLDKARDVYGTYGFWQWSFEPELRPRGIDPATGQPVGVEEPPPIMDVSIRMEPGEQFFVNRLTFTGNSTTHDSVIRREMRVAEGGVFNAEALKQSVRRLNQLGYFKPIEEGDAIGVTPSPGIDDRVDVTVKVEEQNRNQVSFGAGLSQYEGFSGNLSFQTANFLGRGETVSIALLRAQRGSSNQIAFTEPYLFDRPITGGAQIYSRKNDYYGSDGLLAYSEVRSGAGSTLGFFVAPNTRFFGGYTYEVIEASVRDDIKGSLDDAAGALAGLYLDEGRHIESRFSPSLVYDTVDHPLMPRSGMRATGSVDFAGGPVLRGATDYVKPQAELIVYRPHTSKTAIGLRGQVGWVRPFGRTSELPYYQRYYLGGEYQIRGVDLRSVGPMDENQRILGGNKFLLFSAEYYYDLFGSLRLLAFHDAGQAFEEGTRMHLRNLRTSSGAEARFQMPVLNVPFRLIYFWNIYRDSFQPRNGFKFAVGTSF